MRWEFIGILLLFLFLISFGFQSVFGDQIKALGINHQGIPLTCIFEPHPTITDKRDEIIQASENAVQLWEDKLLEHSPNGNWPLYTTIIPIELHNLKTPWDFPSCSILISFEYTSVENSLGYTGINFHKSSHKFTHAVIFLNSFEQTPKIQITFGNSGGTTEMKEKIIIEELSIPVIQNIILHEYGHALGLGHYNVTSAPVSDTPWLTRSAMYYAINPYNDTLMEPKYADIMMLEKIYYTDGFGGTPITRVPMTGYYNPGDDDICTFKCKVW